MAECHGILLVNFKVSKSDGFGGWFLKPKFLLCRWFDWGEFTGVDKWLQLSVNIGNPDEISLNDFAHEILQLTGNMVKIEYLPLPADDPKQRQPDITKGREILGWEPKSE